MFSCGGAMKSASAASSVLSFLLLLPTLPRPAGAAAQLAPTIHETASAVLVEVPVTVVGRDRRPIRGLGASDFQVLDEKHAQRILAFDAVELPGRQADQSVSPYARRRFLLLFDLSFSEPQAIVRARRAADDFVRNLMSDDDLAAVATYSVERGFRLLVTFSGDRTQLARAIETLGMPAASVRPADPLAFAFESPGRLGIENERSVNSERAGIDLELARNLRALKALVGRQDRDYETERATRAIESFGALARALDSVSGRKHIILFSQGFDDRIYVGDDDHSPGLQENEAIVRGETWLVDNDKRFGNSRLQQMVNDTLDLFRRSDCVVDTVNITGLTAAGGVSGGALGTGDNWLTNMAASTGGEAIRNANDLHRELARLLAQTSLVYVLTFRPDRRLGPGRYHHLQVIVRKANARVSTRAGYYEGRSFTALSPLERSLSAADIVANEIPASDFPIAAIADAFASGDARAEVPVMIKITGRDLLRQFSGGPWTLDIFAYATASHRLRDFFTEAVPIDLAAAREILARGGLMYCGELQLPPGAYRLRILVRCVETGRSSFLARPLRVPDFAAGLSLLPPLFLQSTDGWVFVRSRAAAKAPKKGRSDPLLEFAPRSLTPVPGPELRPLQAATVALVTYGLHPSSGTERLRIAGQILDRDGRPKESARLDIVGMTVPDRDGKRTFLLRFKPGGLAPGSYSLRLFVEDPVTNATRQASSPFSVR
jgi:VWFA-related protein